MKSYTRNAAFNIAGEAVRGFQWDGVALAWFLMQVKEPRTLAPLPERRVDHSSTEK
ncbi:hypothetical protein LCGC14_0333490 [marine sediment metagenome]|uniref:Uncharacterized protein n=1 Tax=marine sediment metagenome TaxID=412755 RepID=A0A0F9W323_9ZZZZ